MKRLILISSIVLALVLPASATAWPTWGNLENNDCAFAAAANWELLHGGTTATEESILAEWEPLNLLDGISGEEFENYWWHHGIGGRKVNMRETTPDRLRTVMRHHGATVAMIAVTPGEKWGNVEDELGGIHFLVVRYITRRGPVVLTWGMLGQMTWRQWQEDSLIIYVPV